MSVMNSQPTLPIPISLVGNKFLLFDIDAITWLRRTHHICGVMGGTLPQSPSQNVFLGLPMQIMPEEAQLLVEKGVGYLVDDHYAHDQITRNKNSARYADYMIQIRRKAEAASNIRTGQREQLRKQALSKQKNKKQKAEEPSPPPETSEGITVPKDDEETDSTFFSPASPLTTITQSTSSLPSQSFSYISMTPATSAPLLSSSTQPPSQSSLVPNLPTSYPLYRHLNAKSFFTTPGLRFGCQYCVYPGDPLRFHSHFLAIGVEWEQPIDLMDIVGGGRLGTGVKKGWLFGGVQPMSGLSDREGHNSNGIDDEKKEDSNGEGRVRTFSVEWAAM